MLATMLLAASVLAGAACGRAARKPPQAFSYADNGKVVSLALGRRAVVKLDTLNWTFEPIAGTALRAAGAQRLVYLTKGCTAPNGCGYVALTVEAVARGRGVVAAERSSCGEAARCPPDRRKFAVTVIVH